jgi:hypothetical protein
MVCDWLLLLPQASVATYVRVIVKLFGQLLALTESLKCEIVTVEQSSLATTAESFAAGTAFAQLTVASAGTDVIVGAVLSITLTFVDVPLTQPSATTANVTLKLVLQPAAATTLTVCAFAAPSIDAAPLTDQA